MTVVGTTKFFLQQKSYSGRVFTKINNDTNTLTKVDVKRRNIKSSNPNSFLIQQYLKETSMKSLCFKTKDSEQGKFCSYSFRIKKININF